MANVTDFGKRVKVRLIEMDKNQEWLIKKVQERTELYFDSPYLWRILTGQLKSPNIISAICDILELDYSVPEQKSDKTDS